MIWDAHHPKCLHHCDALLLLYLYFHCYFSVASKHIVQLLDLDMLDLCCGVHRDQLLLERKTLENGILKDTKSGVTGQKLRTYRRRDAARDSHPQRKFVLILECFLLSEIRRQKYSSGCKADEIRPIHGIREKIQTQNAQEISRHLYQKVYR